MIIFKSTKDKKAGIKTLAGILSNLSAAWFAAAFIVPNFIDRFSDINSLMLLTGNIIFGIFCLVLTYKLERKLL